MTEDQEPGIMWPIASIEIDGLLIPSSMLKPIQAGDLDPQNREITLTFLPEHDVTIKYPRDLRPVRTGPA